MNLAEWGPIGNSLIYIRENNIYFKKSVISPEIQITTDGDPNVFNGICDWVYEEEVFSTKTAVWISPDNKQMAYVQFDDSEVRHINIPVYGQAGAPQDQYPGVIEFPYPKTGSRNPFVKLFLVNLTQAEPEKPIEKIQISPPQEFKERQHIISVVAWANNDTMLSTWMNRIQNDSIVQVCKEQSCRNVMSQQIDYRIRDSIIQKFLFFFSLNLVVASEE